MHRISSFVSVAVLAASLTACSSGGSSGSSVLPQSQFRHAADTVGGGPVLGARTHGPKVDDTVGGGPVLGARTHGPKVDDTVGGGPVLGAQTNQHGGAATP